MKRTFAFLAFVLTLVAVSAQDVYWVFLADKAGSTFDPYTYFDAKAIERYHQCGADLYDITNYPLTQSYVNGVNALAAEEVGTSRWMNAMGVVATPDQIMAIAELPYVLRVQPINSNMQLAQEEKLSTSHFPLSTLEDTTLADQLLRMQGQLFREAGIDGTGVRIAVFDGGFPKVNTHVAFKHLRDSGRILKTWNFCNRKENVYGWNSHGTMTLSCIAGRMKGKDIGLATGAEFLLARTEVEAEPFKEEVWWMQAVEWADKNGANIISSSLGYGKDRYYTKDMDGKSYVGKAGNLAARKGMLVVNSAGNEGDDSHWQYIITPSDADSVLCVGGIEHSLTDYNHISFSSYGPTADGRQKPNVCAFGHAWAASPKKDGTYEKVYGTSFSCPLVAGFAACAWQASKGKTNMELFDLIQRSADLYPYCDYAFGYGVPQASFFVNKQQNTQATPTFRFERLSPTSVSVVFLLEDTNVHVFYKDVDDQGRITTYGKRTLARVDTTVSLDIKGGHRLVVCCNGYTADYRFEQPTDVDDEQNRWISLRSTVVGNRPDFSGSLRRTPALDIPKESHFIWEGYVSLGLAAATTDDELPSAVWSPVWRFGGRGHYRFSKAYSLGLALEYGHTSYRYNDFRVNPLEQAIGVDALVNNANRIDTRKLNTGEWSLELFQRVRFVPGGSLFHKGLHWDLGAYLTLMTGNNYELAYRRFDDEVADSRSLQYNRLSALDDYSWMYGVTTRISYDAVGLYARYRLDGIGQEPAEGHISLPRLEVGILLQF